MMAFSGWGYPGSAFDASDKPALWELIHRKMGCGPADRAPPAEFAAIQVPEPRADAGSVAALRALLGGEHVALDRETRLLHGMGKSYRDLLRARAGRPGRVPDVVVFPESTVQVADIVSLARARKFAIIPFGGGTNIVGGVEPSPALAAPVVTVSLRRMNRLVSLDEVSGTATIEAGALGPEIEQALNGRGYTLGHFPDSFLHSTLGGWLATRSAGMQSDARGKIEDMVVSLKIVTPVGMLATRVAARSATGPDLNQIVVGSEGTVGIITEATMTVHRRGVQAYHGVLMPDFRSGVELMRRCSREDSAPSTMRLSNAEETELGLTLKPPGGPGARAFKAMVKAYLRRVRGFNLGEACLLILGWEGSAGDVGRRRARSLAIARGLNGFSLGESAGNAWFDRKYDYPLLRDLVMEHGGMVDVTEATVTWRDAMATYERVHGAMHRELCREAFPGYVGCHLSHAYETGVCIYFTFAAARAKGAEMEQYLRAKALSVELLLGAGASLSHHHSIGYEHLPWMEDYVGPAGMAALRGLKAALDPGNICNPGKLLPSAESALGQYWPGYPAGVGAGRAP